MPIFSERSKNNLCECHEDLQTIFNEVIKYFDFTVICGRRNEADQNKAYKEKNSKLKYPNSKHNKNPSMAVDAVPYPIDWKDTNRMKYFAGHVMGIAKLLKDRKIINHAIRWGSDWDRDTDLNDQDWYDLPHFELI